MKNKEKMKNRIPMFCSKFFPRSYKKKKKNYRPWRELKLFWSENPPNLAIFVELFGCSTRWNEKKRIFNRRSSFAFRAPYIIFFQDLTKVR